MDIKLHIINDLNSVVEVRMASIAGSKGGIHIKDKPVKIKVAIRR